MKHKVLKKQNKIVLPTLRGRIGDWFYYSTILSFGEIEKRIYLPQEIDSHSQENEKLGDWIQRDLIETRTNRIVDYLNSNPQRFFNSLILGIYGGKPSFQGLEITLPAQSEETISEETVDYLGRTFGILTLNGDEKIFAIDGQHRAIGIREAVRKNSALKEDEVAVIFLGHSTSIEGKIRTRRLFSTLNRYAKPVNQSEIIALSEDDNCAIITRNLVDSDLLKDKILINKNRSISPDNKTAFTNILTLYDIVKRMITNEKVIGQSVPGKPVSSYTTSRIQDEEIKIDTKYALESINLIINSIPSLKQLFDGREIDRKLPESNLIFRPIGQNIIFDVIKITNAHDKTSQLLTYLQKDTFNLKNNIWKKIFIDEKTGNILTEKPRQRYATILILEAFGIFIKRTSKDLEVYQNFNIKAEEVTL
jgi:DNA sulfur modification protein DndB